MSIVLQNNTGASTIPLRKLSAFPPEHLEKALLEKILNFLDNNYEFISCGCSTPVLDA